MKEEKIIKLQSVYKDYIWGGTKIRDVLKKDTGNMERIAESWELSTHPAGQTTIAEGEYTGKTLNEYFEIVGWDKLGEYGKKCRRLPLLVKYIDAKENLSIQVHPSDEYALEHENDYGKNELWFIINAEEDAFICLGFNKKVSKNDVVNHIQDNSLETLLNKIKVKAGETYFIPARTVHAIGKGCLICEVQQTSNVTYRLYDFNRKVADGTKRELSVEKALAVADLNEYDNFYINIAKNDFMHNKIYNIVYFECCKSKEYVSKSDKMSFIIITEGFGKICLKGKDQQVIMGESYLIENQPYEITGSCNAVIIEILGVSS